VAFGQNLVARDVRLIHSIPGHDPSYPLYESPHYFTLAQTF